MYYLEKCDNCTRHGNVALEEGDTLCNVCKQAQESGSASAKESDDSDENEEK